MEQLSNSPRRYVVHCSVNGHQRKTTVVAASSFEARQQVKRDNPGAVDVFAVVAK